MFYQFKFCILRNLCYNFFKLFVSSTPVFCVLLTLLSYVRVPCAISTNTLRKICLALILCFLQKISTKAVFQFDYFAYNLKNIQKDAKCQCILFYYSYMKYIILSLTVCTFTTIVLRERDQLNTFFCLILYSVQCTMCMVGKSQKVA